MRFLEVCKIGLCGGVTFSRLETKISHTGPNLENMVDEVAVLSPIRPIWPCRGRKCEPVRCHDGRALFSSPNGAVFSAIRRRIGPIIRHSTALRPFFPSTGSRCRSHLVNPKKRGAITFPADGTVFAIFGAGSSGEVHCFDCSLVSGVYQWIHVSSTVTKRRRKSFGLRLNSVKH